MTAVQKLIFSKTPRTPHNKPINIFIVELRVKVYYTGNVPMAQKTFLNPPLFHTIGGSFPVYINSDDSAILWRWMYDKC